MKTLVAMILGLTIAKTACADQSVAPYEAILAQEEAWAAALVADDLDKVASIMHRDFRLVRTYSDAPPINKEAYLGMNGMSVAMADVTSVAIIAEIGSIAVARVTMSMEWAQEGVGELPPNFELIDTWKRDSEGGWRILSRVSHVADKPSRPN